MHSKKKLLLFHFAGGTRYSLNHLSESINKEIELVHTELPGRGGLIQMGLCPTLQENVDFLYNHWILPNSISSNDICYGHSMGGLLAYLMCKKIQLNNQVLPKVLIISGCSAPSIGKSKKIGHLSGDAFWKELNELGGIPKEFFEHPELKEFYEPILKSDINMVESYIHTPSNPLNIPIITLFGSSETLSLESKSNWSKETTHPLQTFEFKGGHFFINHPENIKKITDIIHQQFRKS